MKISKKQALANYLGCEETDISQAYRGDEALLESDTIQGEYLVLDEDEADERTKDYINESLWAFNADFIACHTRTSLSEKQIDAIADMQAKLCEDANEIVRALIYDFDHFVQDAINADGRGHFLAPYDGEEQEQNGYYIYRVN